MRKLSIFGGIKINVLGPDFFDQGFENLETLALFEENFAEVLKTDVFINLPNLQTHIQISELHNSYRFYQLVIN
jgi:hypothetical protein